jgi:hypothetical protein
MTVGKQIGEDSEPIRSSETQGVIIVETGASTLGEVAFTAGMESNVV